MTKLYNLINDSKLPAQADAEIAQLRSLHVELDIAVLQAYGWSDIPLDHGFYSYRQMERWTICPAAREELLDRLLEENHRRAASDVRLTRALGQSQPTDMIALFS